MLDLNAILRQCLIDIVQKREEVSVCFPSACEALRNVGVHYLMLLSSISPNGLRQVCRNLALGRIGE